MSLRSRSSQLHSSSQTIFFATCFAPSQIRKKRKRSDDEDDGEDTSEDAQKHHKLAAEVTREKKRPEAPKGKLTITIDTLANSQRNKNKDPAKVRPKDTAIYFSAPGGGFVTVCGWCGKTFKNLQSMGGHVTLHAQEPGYPSMPRPGEDVLKKLEEEGYKECERG